MVGSFLPTWENEVSQEIALQPEQPARKQQQRSVVTQQKLLDAAIEAFSENGFKGTSTRDIAERAAGSFLRLH